MGGGLVGDLERPGGEGEDWRDSFAQSCDVGMRSRTTFLDFSFHWIMRLSQPTGVCVMSSHASSECALTWDCTKMTDLAGSMPQAMYRAAAFRVSSWRAMGSCGRVIA